MSTMVTRALLVLGASILVFELGVGPALAHDHTHGPTTTTGGSCTKKGLHYQNSLFPANYATTEEVSSCSSVQAKLCYLDNTTGNFDLNIHTTAGTIATASGDHFGHIYWSDHNGLSGSTWWGFRLADHTTSSC